MNAVRRLWLLFTQAVTVCLGILFVVAALRPVWLRMSEPGVVPSAQAPVGALSAPTASADLRTPPPKTPVTSNTARDSYADAVARAAPAVVNVYTTKRVERSPRLPNDPGMRRFLKPVPGVQRSQIVTSLGSGVIVDRAGHVLTNYHVVEAADAIEVALDDGRTSQAKVLGADPESDLAVLKLSVALTDLPVATLASDKSLRVGDVVLAIGDPFAVGQTTTQGIVSALGRSRLGINTYEDFIQTDAAINPGNSGGALIDTDGNLVGINTALYSPSGGSLGIGFSIPIASARHVMEQILHSGSVTRGWLGVEPQDMTPDLARSFGLRRGGGVVIAGVMRGGPAGRAGMRVGDIVQAIEGAHVVDTPSLLAMIAALPPGHTAQMSILRGGKAVLLHIKVGTRPPSRR
jgi:Do/DeqQ family serine protease